MLALFCLLSPLLLGYEIDEHKTVTSRKPVSINANQLNFDRLRSLTLFKGKVKAVHGKVTLTSDELRAIADNHEATALGHILVVDSGTAMTLTCGNLEYQDLMDLMTAHDHPILTAQDENGLPITIIGRQMVLDSENKTAQINQDVSILHGDGKAEAQKATYFSQEDKLVLEDNPKITMKDGDMSGRRIVTSFGGDRTVICEGMAEANFYPQGNTAPSAPLTGTVPAVSTPGVAGSSGVIGTPTPSAGRKSPGQ
jgi:lipopolysaccharide export system protein LptA